MRDWHASTRPPQLGESNKHGPSELAVAFDTETCVRDMHSGPHAQFENANYRSRRQASRTKYVPSKCPLGWAMTTGV